MKEGQDLPKSNPEKKGETEKNNFIQEVTGLVRSPRSPEFFSPVTGRVHKDPSSWESKYKKKGSEESVYVSIPVPGKDPEMTDEVSATVLKPLFMTDKWQTAVEKKEISVRINDPQRKMNYYEEVIFYDERGKEVDPQAPEPIEDDTYEAIYGLADEPKMVFDGEQGVWVEEVDFVAQANQLQSGLQYLRDRKALELDKVTPERYTDIMDTLKSLTPDDQVLPEDE